MYLIITKYIIFCDLQIKRSDSSPRIHLNFEVNKSSV